jgi:hypothetical protein
MNTQVRAYAFVIAYCFRAAKSACADMGLTWPDFEPTWVDLGITWADFGLTWGDWA